MPSPLAITEKELRAAGIAYRVENGKRHPKVRFRIRGRECMVVCSRTASDHRALQNARQTVRRVIREALG